MTISSTNVKAQFAGNLVTTAFPFTFKTYQAADVLVTLTDTLGVDSVLTLNADYTIALNVDQNASPGGTITYLLYKATGLPLPVGARLTALSNASDLQGTSLVNGGAFFASNVTDMADLRTIISHQKQEAIDRAIKFPSSDVAPSAVLANAAARANKYLSFDGSGNVQLATGAVIVSPTVVPLLLADQLPYLPYAERQPVYAFAAGNTIGGPQHAAIAKATGSFAQLYATAAGAGPFFPAALGPLGSGWYITYKNTGTGVIVHTPFAGQTIDGQATLSQYPGETWFIFCDGSNLQVVYLDTGPVRIATMSGAAARYDFIGLTGFQSYKFRIQGLSFVNNPTDFLRIRVSEDNGGSFITSANYAFAGVGTPSDGTGAPVPISGSATSYIQGSCLLKSSVSGEILLDKGGGLLNPNTFNIKLAGSKSAAASDWFSYSGMGVFYLADGNAINGVELSGNSDNINSSSVTLFGYR